MEYICEVKSEQEGKNLLQSISRLTIPELTGASFNFFCDSSSWINELKEKLDNSGIKNSLYKLDRLSSIVEDLSDSGVVVWLTGQVVLEPEQIENLRNDLVGKLNAGLVSGINSTNLLVDDVYSPSKLLQISKKGFIPVDIVDSSLFVCRGSTLKELNFDKRFFGLNLRQLGYQNYADTNIELNKENKNAENNNAEGVA